MRAAPCATLLAVTPTSNTPVPVKPSIQDRDWNALVKRLMETSAVQRSKCADALKQLSDADKQSS